MATNLTFTKNSQNLWETSYSTTGERVALEIIRTSSGPLIVKGNVGGLNDVTIKDFGPGAPADLLVDVDLPAGVSVSIVSFTEVTSAKVSE